MFNYKKLLGDSAIFAVGSLGSKLVSFLLVPFYTYYLTTSDYGTVDVMTVTINLFLPVISLSVYDAALRFGVSNKDDRKIVFSNGVIITLFTNVISLLTYPILNYFDVFGDYLIFIYVILFLKSFQTLSAQYTRAIGEIKVFSLNGIFMVLAIGISNIILLRSFNLGVFGYLLSIIVGQIFSIIFLFILAKLYNYFELSEFSYLKSKELLNYSIPLIPNAVSLWITSASSQYFILFFVGVSASGLFAVSNRIPSFLTMISSIFFQAWQLSAIKEYGSSNKSIIYTQVFSYFSMAMFIATSGILMVLKLVLSIILSPEFFSAWKYVPFLLLSTVFSSFSGFLGTNYIAAKETKGVLKTTMIMAVISTTLNFIFIPLIGTYGAGISMMISYFSLWIIRVKDTKKYVEIKVNKKNVCLSLVLILAQITTLYLFPNIVLSSLVQMLCFITIICINRQFFKILKKFPLKNS